MNHKMKKQIYTYVMLLLLYIMIIINVLNPVYGKTNNNDIIINNNNNDKLIHVQYKIEKGSIVVPLASSTLPCLNSNKIYISYMTVNSLKIQRVFFRMSFQILTYSL